ncbi:MAG TPA: lipid-A-disaccharide synthase [Bacteroidia bacterium]|jgi:lipid-A-disaccharide synthase|nr:lipid-A-disaccharide synthase [Bacteroidia bacterium]
MNYYVIAGEPSGDLHASNLLRELKKADQKATFRCWGGDLMKAEGGEIVKHYKELAFMGFIEVVANLRTIFKNIAFCKEDILKHKPDALILVDYPGFNLRIAKWAKQQGIRVFYYISPTVWGWQESRVNIVKECVERMFVILPFEKPFYAKHNCEVDYFGHPLSDIVNAEKEKIISRNDFLKKHNLPDKPIIALFPGSRKQELNYILPDMLKAVKHFPDYQFVIGASATFSQNNYEAVTKGFDVKIIKDDTYALMFHARAGLVKSGTSILEAALFGLPMALCYSGNAISVQITRMVIKVKWIGLVNLILNKNAVTELIQRELNETRIVEELTGLLEGPKRNQLLAEYNIIQGLLQAGNVSAKIAAEIYRRLQHEKA